MITGTIVNIDARVFAIVFTLGAIFGGWLTYAVIGEIRSYRAAKRADLRLLKQPRAGM